MIPYICYNDLEEFYTLKSVCNLLKMDKGALKPSCKRYDINPQRNEISDWGLSRYDLRSRSLIGENVVSLQVPQKRFAPVCAWLRDYWAQRDCQTDTEPYSDAEVMGLRLTLPEGVQGVFEVRVLLDATVKLRDGKSPTPWSSTSSRSSR